MGHGPYEQRRQVAEVMWAGFYRCPNNGRIVELLPGDDKVLCRCGHTLPQTPRGFPGVHLARLMERVSTDAYLAQCDVDEQERERSRR